MNPSQYRLKIQAIRTNLIPWCEEILKGFDKEIVGLIQEQLAEGMRGDGTQMPRYSFLTKQSKLKRGTILMGDRIALIDTGEFWQSMFSYIGSGIIEVGAKDWKESTLIDRYKPEIFLISKKQMSHLADLVRPQLTAKIQSFLAS